MVTSTMRCSCPPIADSTKPMPPAFGFSRCVNGEALRWCFSGVKRVPSTKFMIDTGMVRNFSQALRVVSMSLPFISGCLAR